MVFVCVCVCVCVCVPGMFEEEGTLCSHGIKPCTAKTQQQGMIYDKQLSRKMFLREGVCMQVNRNGRGGKKKRKRSGRLRIVT